jgi:hypothetical protein
MAENDFDEEIDFKPLSKGLGFHQKKLNFEAENLSFSAPNNFSGSNNLSSSDSELMETNEFKSPIHIEKDDESFSAEPSSSLKPVWSTAPSKTQNSWGGDVDLGLAPREDGIVDRDTFSQPLVIDNPFYVPKKPYSPVEVVTLRFSGHDGLKKDKSKPVNPSFVAILIDVLTLISLCMIFSTLYFASTGQSLSDVILAMPYNSALKNQFIGLTMSIGFLYLIISRCFFGRTIGEWMFHLQLGSLRDQEKPTYPLRVFIRTFIVFATGFVLFPLISYLFKKDFLVYFSGLELHGEKI